MIEPLSNRSLRAVAATALLMLPLPAGAQQIDPFYATRLEDGIRALERGDHPRAIEERLDMWLETAAILRSRVPGCRFVLVGDGPERGALERRARELGLTDAVHFTGLLDDVRPALWAFDVMLVSSRFEGLPLVVLEAMAASVPIVATAVGGIPEAIEDGSSGILVQEPNAEALARATAELLGTPGLGDRLGRTALARVTEIYSSEAMQRRLESLYLEVLAR